jgi:large subunit ribosomal protein L20
MAKAKYRVASHKRRKRILKAAKGFRGGRGKLYRTAKEALMKARVYSYRDRKVRKRFFRRLWISRINAACRGYGVKYSQFIDGLKKAKITLDRKVLADLATANKTAFKKLIDLIKTKNT